MSGDDWTLFTEFTGLAGTRWIPAARATDPETSQFAAASNREHRLNLGAEVLVALMKNPSGMTDWEIAAEVGRHQPSVGKRRGELVALGLVEFTGEYRLSPLGQKCRVWAVKR